MMNDRLLVYSAKAGNIWTRPGYPNLLEPTGPTDPNWPEPGTYKPGPGTTGTTNVDDLDVWVGDYTVNTAGREIKDLEIFGRIMLQTNATDPHIHDCIVRGPGSNYQSSGTNYTAAIASTSASMRNALIEDVTIDLTGRESHWVDGIRGANYHARRMEITGTVDGFSLTHRDGNQTIEANWVHNGFYDEWNIGTANRPTSPSDRRTHNDAIQFHAGKNIRIVGNYLGGWRAQGGVQTYDPVIVAQKNGGDDYENSGIMLKQEIDSTLANKIENVLIDRNWFEGGAACMNIAPDRDNFFESVQVTRNRFIRAQPGVHGGYYILRASTYQGTLVGNVFDDTGTPVTITNG